MPTVQLHDSAKLSQPVAASAEKNGGDVSSVPRFYGPGVEKWTAIILARVNQ
jgi:hypothetical protein